MAAFEEILGLEQEESELRDAIQRTEQAVRAMAKRNLTARQDLEETGGHVRSLLQMVRNLHKADVVLLSEYDHVSRTLQANQDLLVKYQSEIQLTAQQGKTSAAQLKTQQAQLAQVRRDLARYGKVVEFRK